MEYHGLVQVSDHLLWLVQDPSPHDLVPPPTGVPGFVHFGNGGAIIKTGVAGGQVDVTVAVLDEGPPLDVTTWEDIDEGDLLTEAGGVYVAGGYSFENIIPGSGDTLIARTASAHRVRVSASGRAANFDEAGDDERYFIQMWPVTETTEGVVHRFQSGR